MRCPRDAYGYFGYLKKMTLTLNNAVMLRRVRLPFHGALVDITLAGKRMRALRIVADDMGSLELTQDGRLLGYGTETGAFVRLDDLHRGNAFGQIDRAIFMSPRKVNARVVVPVTTLEEVITPHPVDFILYANNYEEGQVLERFSTPMAALAAFRAGRAMGKGTTAVAWFTESYFANPFGAPEFRETYDALAERVFQAAFASGIFVGQIRTQLAFPGCERTGPAAAAEALLELLG